MCYANDIKENCECPSVDGYAVLKVNEIACACFKIFETLNIDFSDC